MMMNTKKKTMLIISIVALGYLGYQVYGWATGDIGVMPQTAELAHQVNTQPILVASAAVDDAQEKNDSDEQPALEAGQRAYLSMVNQYELVKMERQLLDEKAAIAAARLKIATLNKKTREIDRVIDKTPEYGEVSAVSNWHSGELQLNCVDRLNGQWSATLEKNGHYYQVHVGSTLEGHYTVTNISREGVILKEGRDRRRLTFSGIEILPKEHDTVVANAQDDKERL